METGHGIREKQNKEQSVQSVGKYYRDSWISTGEE